MHSRGRRAARMVDLGTLNDSLGASVATALNDSGQVVGYSNVNDVNNDAHAFSWTAAGGMVDLGTLGGSQSFPGADVTGSDPAACVTEYGAQAINGNGDVVGRADTPSGATHAVLWSPKPQLSVSLAGSGSGTVSGSGVSCPGTCSSSYPPGTTVTLSAAPRPVRRLRGGVGRARGRCVPGHDDGR